MVGVVPISQLLRYRIPFAAPEATVQYLAARRGQAPAVTVVDDGKKFGVWPGPHRHVCEEGWLDRLLDLGWLRLATLGEMVAGEPAAGRVYLPTASYREMGEWALPVEAGRELRAARRALATLPDGERWQAWLRGGFWRAFLVKYPEVADLHWKMLRLSPDRYLDLPDRPALRSRGRARDLTRLLLVDDWAGLAAELRWSPTAEVAWGPVETVSVSQAGLERAYQGTAFLIVWSPGTVSSEPCVRTALTLRPR